MLEDGKLLGKSDVEVCPIPIALIASMLESVTNYVLVLRAASMRGAMKSVVVFLKDVVQVSISLIIDSHYRLLPSFIHKWNNVVLETEQLFSTPKNKSCPPKTMPHD